MYDLCPRVSIYCSALKAVLYSQTSILTAYCQQTYLSSGAALTLLRAAHSPNSPHLPSIMAWNLAPLSLNVSTLYMFTKTGPGSSSKTGPLRVRYFERHIRTVHEHLRILSEHGGYDSSTNHLWESGAKRQMVWIIVEDNFSIDPDIALALRSSSIPFIYFAFGPTHHHGNAQQNAAYTMIASLSHSQTGIFQHGPVLSIDDDSEIKPELLDIVWKVRRIGVWPMGNLGPDGCTSFSVSSAAPVILTASRCSGEGPVYDENHNLVDWPAGAIGRFFTVDNGAFSVCRLRTDLFDAI